VVFGEASFPAVSEEPISRPLDVVQVFDGLPVYDPTIKHKL